MQFSALTRVLDDYHNWMNPQDTAYLNERLQVTGSRETRGDNPVATLMAQLQRWVEEEGKEKKTKNRLARITEEYVRQLPSSMETT